MSEQAAQQSNPGQPASAVRYGWSQRAIAVVLLIAAVLVAGGIAGAAKSLDDADDRLFTDVDRDQVVRIGEDATMRITGISVGSSLAQRDVLIATSGRFVVVEYEVIADREKGPNVRVELNIDGKTYRSLDDAYETMPAGFAGNRASLFEVPPGALEGEVEFVFGRSELVYSHQHWVRWRPTITDEDLTSSELQSVALPETKLWVAP